ncbi:MAG TPA: efflux RND transporter permease subunit [Myxococcota bacterium]|nr:efflux RND transporter permease subunit [Myxococcota bacterium]
MLEAAAARLRPILMTTFSTLFGILPIALGVGGSAGSRRSLGIAVISGLVLSTGLTLYLVPAVYSVLSRRRREAPEAAPLPEPAAG